MNETSSVGLCSGGEALLDGWVVSSSAVVVSILKRLRLQVVEAHACLRRIRDVVNRFDAKYV